MRGETQAYGRTGKKSGMMNHKMTEAMRKENIKDDMLKDRMTDEECNESAIKACQHVVESEIIFGPPEKDRVIELIKVETEFKVKDVEVSTNTIVVTGFIHKGIIYKSIKAMENKDGKDGKDSKDDKDDKDNRNGRYGRYGRDDDDDDKYSRRGRNDRYSRYDDDDKDNKDEKGDKDSKDKKDGKDDKDKKGNKLACTTYASIPTIVDGVVRHSTVWIPVRCLMAMNGARKGDACEVVSCKLVDGYSKTTELKHDEECECTSTSDLGFGPKYIKGIFEKDLIDISVKVKKQSR